MTHAVTYSERLTEVIDTLYAAGADLCQAIKRVHPDVIVCLMHSGRGPLLAAQNLWSLIPPPKLRRFPPVVYANLGREKFAGYNQIPDRRGATNSFVGELELLDAQAHFYAWLLDQSDWLAELRSLVEAVHRAPRRILIADDFVAEGSTRLLAFLLLHLLYPTAKIGFWSMGVDGWKQQIARCWLAKIAPQVLEQLDKTEAGRTFRNFELESRIGNLVIGTENHQSDPAGQTFAWQFLLAGGPASQDLAKYNLNLDWLALPGYFERALQAGLARWQANPKQPAQSHNSGLVFPYLPWKFRELQVLRLAYHLPTFDLATAYAHSGLSQRRTRLALQDSLDDGWLIRRGRGSHACYSLAPQPDYAESAEIADQLDAWWGVPGQVLVGALPGWVVESMHLNERLEWLVSQGARYFLQVEYSGEEQAIQAAVKELGARLNLPLEYAYCKTTDQRDVNLKQLRFALVLLSQAVSAGQVVYLFGRNSFGAPAVVLGCWLAQTRLSGQRALNYITCQRQGSRNAGRPAPATAALRRLVRTWQG